MRPGRSVVRGLGGRRKIGQHSELSDDRSEASEEKPEISEVILDARRNGSATMPPMARSMRRNGQQPRSRSRYAAVERAADRREAARLIQLLGEPAVARERIKVSIRRTAALLRWEPSRAEDIWRLDARRIDAWEMDALRDNVRKLFRERGPCA